MKYIWIQLNELRTTTGKLIYRRPASPLRKIARPSLIIFNSVISGIYIDVK